MHTLHESTAGVPRTSDFPTTDLDDTIRKLMGNRQSRELAQILSLRGEEAIDILDSLQFVSEVPVLSAIASSFIRRTWQWLDANLYHEGRRRVIKALTDIAVASNELPSSLFIKDVVMESTHPANFGAYADVFRGSLHGQKVALKRLRLNDEGLATNDLHRVCLIFDYKAMMQKDNHASRNSVKKLSHGGSWRIPIFCLSWG